MLNNIWSPMYEVKLPQVSVSMRRRTYAIYHVHPYVVLIYVVTLHKHTMHVDVYPYLLYLVRYIQKLYSIYVPSNIVRVTKKGNYMYMYIS